MKKVALTIAVTVFLGGCAMSDTNTSPIPAQSSAISAEPSQAPSSAENQAILYFVSDTGKSFRLFSEQHDLISSSERPFPSSLARWITNPLRSSSSSVDGSLSQKLKADKLHGEPIAG